MKKIIIFLFALFCGATTSQFPEFSQQYRQRLDGAIAELAQIIKRFDADALASELSRDEALQRYSDANDEFLAKRGTSMRDVINRHDYLSKHQTRLQTAGQFERLWVFARESDNELARATLNIYEPAVPITPEGATHAAGGFLTGWGILALLFSPFRRRRKAA